MTPDLFGLEPRHHAGGKVALPLQKGVRGAATFHGDGGCYRSMLWRELGEPEEEPRPFALWIGMNPSVAAGDVDDPTVRMEWEYTLGMLGLRGYRKANVADYCATKPKALRFATVPVRSVQNLPIILAAAAQAKVVVAAWGAEKLLADHARETALALREAGIQLMCLGTTKAGQPRHPLYVKRTTPLIPWSMPHG